MRSPGWRIFAFVLILASSSVFGQAATPITWRALLAAGKVEDARKLCEENARSPIPRTQADGFKCLANVVLQGKDGVAIRANESGGGTIEAGYADDATAQAVKYLTSGIAVTPQDVTIHQGRLWLLMSARRYDEMMAALEESISLYKGKDPTGVWVSYSADLMNAGNHRTAIRSLKLLEEKLPADYRVQGNLSAAYAYNKEDDAALGHARQAVALAPKDPINAWNLGRILEYMNRLTEAEQAYVKALSLEADSFGGKTDPARQCIYAELLVEKLKTPERLCGSPGAGCAAYADRCKKRERD